MQWRCVISFKTSSLQFGNRVAVDIEMNDDTTTSETTGGERVYPRRNVIEIVLSNASNDYIRLA
jgi:hypothetical protein